MGRILLSEVIKPLSSSNAPIKNKASKTPLDGWYPAYSASGQDVWLPQFRYEGNGIVVSSVGARCGKAFKATGKWNIVANTQPLQLDETMIDFDYAWRLLNNEEWWVKSGTGQPFVKVKASLNRTVQLPCLEDQRLISNKLNKLDENVSRLASLQAVLDNLVKSRFPRMAVAA